MMEAAKPTPVPNDFLPRSAIGRIVVAILAFPSFLVFTFSAIAFVLMSFEVTDIIGIALLHMLTQGLGAASIFSLLALVWAVATPEWIVRLMRRRARALCLVGGLYLVFGGTMIGGFALFAQQFVAAGLMGAGIVLGVAILCNLPFGEPIPLD